MFFMHVASPLHVRVFCVCVCVCSQKERADGIWCFSKNKWVLADENVKADFLSGEQQISHMLEIRPHYVICLHQLEKAPWYRVATDRVGWWERERGHIFASLIQSLQWLMCLLHLPLSLQNLLPFWPVCLIHPFPSPISALHRPLFLSPMERVHYDPFRSFFIWSFLTTDRCWKGAIVRLSIDVVLLQSGLPLQACTGVRFGMSVPWQGLEVGHAELGRKRSEDTNKEGREREREGETLKGGTC